MSADEEGLPADLPGQDLHEEEEIAPDQDRTKRTPDPTEEETTRTTEERESTLDRLLQAPARRDLIDHSTEEDHKKEADQDLHLRLQGDTTSPTTVHRPTFQDTPGLPETLRSRTDVQLPEATLLGATPLLAVPRDQMATRTFIRMVQTSLTTNELTKPNLIS